MAHAGVHVDRSERKSHTDRPTDFEHRLNACKWNARVPVDSRRGDPIPTWSSTVHSSRPRSCAASSPRAGPGRGDGTLSSGVVEWDETLEALSGLAPGTFGSTYEAWLATLHPDEVESILELVNDAIERRGGYHFEHRAMWPDGTEHWLECRGQVTTDADGTVTGTVGCAVDITDRRIAEDLRDIVFERERRLRDRFEFLVRVERHRRRRSHSCRVPGRRRHAPRSPSWATGARSTSEPERGSTLQTAVVARRSRTSPRAADRLAELFPYGSTGRGVTAVMATGRTEFLPRVTDDVIEGVLEADDDRCQRGPGHSRRPRAQRV